VWTVYFFNKEVHVQSLKARSLVFIRVMADGAAGTDEPLGYVLLHRHHEEDRSLLLPGARRVGEALAQKGSSHAVEAQTRLRLPPETYHSAGSYVGEKIFTYLYRVDVPYSEIKWMGPTSEGIEPRFVRRSEFLEAVANGGVQTNHLELLIQAGLVQQPQASAA
jgi:hypothetical protein